MPRFRFDQCLIVNSESMIDYLAILLALLDQSE